MKSSYSKDNEGPPSWVADSDGGSVEWSVWSPSSFHYPSPLLIVADPLMPSLLTLLELLRNGTVQTLSA